MSIRQITSAMRQRSYLMVFELNCHLPNHSEGGGNQLSILSKDTTSELVGLILTLSLAKRQAGKL